MRRGLAVTLTLALGWPATAIAGPAEADDKELRAREKYEEGKAKFETADYLGAIEAWTQAYSSLPATKTYAKTKVLLLYNLASARESAYEVDKDVQQLRQAKILLENFEAQIADLYGEGMEADQELVRVQERLDILADKLEEAEAAASGDEGEAPPPVVVDPQKPDPPPTPIKPHRGLIIGGAVASGVGVAGLGLMAGGLVMGNNANDISGLDPTDVDGRRKKFDAGRLGNTLAVVGGVVGGVGLAAGAVLLVMGAKRKSAATARLRPSANGLAVSF